MFQIRLPCDPSSLTRYRQRLSEAGVEELLAQTIAAARKMKAINRSDLKRAVVDSAVQEKNVADPTGSRLLELARRKLVVAAQRKQIILRQSYHCVAPRLARQAGRCAHARQAYAAHHQEAAHHRGPPDPGHRTQSFGRRQGAQGSPSFRPPPPHKIGEPFNFTLEIARK